MEILVYRKWQKAGYTIGRVYIDGRLICNSLEDEDRGLSDAMDERIIRNRKIYGKTAIPRGRYAIDMNTISPKFSKYDFYKEVCDGKLPRLKNVKGFEGILIHVADGPKGADLLEGCIGVGLNKAVGQLCEGKETFRKIYAMMKEAHKRGEVIHITIE
jgi:hypothetical protein